MAKTLVIALGEWGAKRCGVRWDEGMRTCILDIYCSSAFISYIYTVHDTYSEIGKWISPRTATYTCMYSDPLTTTSRLDCNGRHGRAVSPQSAPMIPEFRISEHRSDVM